MATRIEAFTVTIPANTAQNSPVNIQVSFNQGQVTEIDIDIPAGSAGLMGFQLAYGDQPIIPHSPSEYIVRDNTSFRWPLSTFPDGSFWAVIGYNTDIYDHDINLIFLIDDTSQAAATAAAGAAAGTVPEIVVSSGQIPVVQS